MSRDDDDDDDDGEEEQQQQKEEEDGWRGSRGCWVVAGVGCDRRRQII